MSLSQRENCRWHVLETKLHHVEKKWEKCLEELDEEFYNCYGEFDATIERKTHSNLIVSGPIVDVYIKELWSGSLTGIQQSSTILIPWQVCHHNQINKRLWWEYCSKIEKNPKKRASP